MHWLGRHRRVALALICALCTGIIIGLALLRQVAFANSIWANETAFRDALERKGLRTKVHDEFVFLGIDEASKQLDQVSEEEVAGSPALQKMREEFPWSRAVYAELIDKLCDAGARLIIFDLTFDPGRAGDEEFRAALDRHRDRVVIGADIEASASSQTDKMGIIFVPPNKALIPDGFTDDRVGFVSIWPDADSRIRRINYAMTDSQIIAKMNGIEPGRARSGETIYESLDARSLRKLGFRNRIPPPGLSAMIRFGPNDAYQPRSLFEIFVPAYWERNYGNGSFFQNKVVLIGAASAIAHDVHPTPISDVTSGPITHFHSIAAALDGEFLNETGPWTNLALLLGAGFCAWVVVAFVRQTLVALLLLIGLSAGYLAAVVGLYNTQNVFLLTLPVLGSFSLSGLFSLGYDFTLERLEKLRTRRTLERYVSKNLVKEILDNPDSFYSSLRGVRVPATILFSDIVGFTSMTESADPEKLVKQLNEYLSRMTSAVFQHNGTLDKFIGDAVMAVWGNVGSRGVAEDAKACARAAVAMRRELAALNRRWEGEGTAPFHIGIGINHGDVLVGNIGSQEKADPTVIGDAVNLASRLEALTRTYAVDILVGARASELIRDEFHLRSVALVQVKGKTKPVELFTLIGAKGGDGDAEFIQRLETYEAGFRKFRARDFSGAKILFSQFLEFYPDDALAKMYLERSLEYEAQPPDEAWNAVEVFKKK
ncbi:MAG TPA: adenylate/guanylate cyclase domain-containing protein [Chthoniobacterales bacterium]|nr:adenylate/guanylate cyclase domain-containing protein [Chthoniobacterales bacterium]